MKSTIQEVGVIQDPVVRPLPDGSYELISGRSRIIELVSQGAKEIQVKVIEASEATSLIMNIVENVARGTYDYVSISKAIRKLLKLGHTLEDLEKVFPWRKRWIKFIEDLQDLPEDVVEAITTRKITPSHVQLALHLPTPHEVHSGLRTTITHEWDTGIFKTFVNNRVQQISRARKEASAKGVVPIIPVANPQLLVQYKQCLLCGYQKPSDKVNVQLVCETCRDISSYVTANLGSDPEVLQTIYAALQGYFGQPKPGGIQSPGPKPVDVPT